MEKAEKYLANLARFGVHLGLERIKMLLEFLDNPQNNLKFIHIGGTNGKGAVSVMIARILEETGLRTGLFLSPHLSSYRERISVNGELISESELEGILKLLLPLAKKVKEQLGEPPTEFEVLTAASLFYFKMQNTDIAVLEVGLGGKLDSTNIVMPLVAVITTVGFDHQDRLGETIEEIASAKAGIIKERIPIISGTRDETAIKVIEKRAQQQKAPFYLLDRDFFTYDVRTDKNGTRFGVRGLKNTYESLFVPLKGRHQAQNAACAIAALEVIESKGYLLSSAALRKGLERSFLPARMEIIREKPTVILDVAHNPQATSALVSVLNKLSYKRLFLIMGMLADKDRKEAVEILTPFAFKFIVTRPQSERAGNWQEIARMAKGNGEVVIIEDIEKAIDEALREAEDDDLILITGSFYVVGEARQILVQKFSILSK